MEFLLGNPFSTPVGQCIRKAPRAEIPIKMEEEPSSALDSEETFSSCRQSYTVRDRDREKGLLFPLVQPASGRYGQRVAATCCADPKPGARCFLLVSHGGARPKHLGHPPLHCQATAET